MNEYQGKKIMTDNGLIIGMHYQRGNLKWDISVESFCKRRRDDRDNIGAILETYRKILDEGRMEDAVNYLNANNNVVEGFAPNYVNHNAKPDYVQLMTTHDPSRNQVLELFYYKVVSNAFPHGCVPNYSTCFQKRDPSVSITSLSADRKEENYSYFRPPSISTIDKLWIIDDTISTGSTIEIFLDKLFENSLLIYKTEIKVFIIYNNVKSDFAKGWESHLPRLRQEISGQQWPE